MAPPDSTAHTLPGAPGLLERIAELERQNRELAQDVQRHRADLQAAQEDAAEAQALRTQVDQLRAVLDGLPYWVSLKDADGRYLLVNRPMAEAHGLPPDRFLGRQAVADAETDETALRQLLAMDLQVLRTGEPAEWEDYPVTRGDPQPRFRRLVKVPYRGGDGSVQGVIAFSQDITQRRMAEENLRRSEERYRQLVEGSLQGILVHSETKLLYANRAYAEMYGYTSPEDLLALDSASALVAPHERERLRSFRANRLRGLEAPAQYRYAGLRRDGSVIQLETRAWPVVWEGQQAVQMLVVDITDQLRAEEELRASEARFRHLFEATFDGVAIFRLDGTILEVNSAFERVTGFAEGELKGGSIFQVIPPDMHEGARRAHAANRSVRHEARAMRRDGEVFPVELFGNPYPYGGEQARVIALRDISARREQQQALQRRELRQGVLALLGRAALEGMAPESLMRIAVEHTAQALSADLCAVLLLEDLAPPAPAQLRCIAQAGSLSLPGGVQPLHPGGMAAYAIDRQELVFSADLHQEQRFTPAPHLSALNARAAVMAPVVGLQGVHGLLSLFCSDAQQCGPEEKEFVQAVADLLAVAVVRKGVETEREKLVGELARANDELKDFAYIVSHDLKTPLRAINALADWMVDDYAHLLDDEGQENLRLLQNRTRRMAHLLDGILQYSRVGRATHHLVELDANAIVAEVIDSLDVPPGVRMDVDGPLPTLCFDRAQLVQVFQNLLSNAVKHLGRDSGSVRVRGSEGPEAWEFCVADDGVGIDPRHFERIFRIFQALQRADTPDSTGIGLAIVKKIVGLYGGRIWVESQPGRGAAFHFTVPRQPPAQLREVEE